MRKFYYSAIILLLLLRSGANAQFLPAFDNQGQSSQSNPARSKATDRRASSITGQVTTDSGQPIPNTVIRVLESGKLRPSMRSTSTDGQGRFRVEDLARGVYSIIPEAPGYILEDEDFRQRSRRPGDSVTVRLVKGGVITGTVTDFAGDPKVAIKVRALLARDKDGRVVPNRLVSESATDDRGVYRIYGLRVGSYVIQANDRESYYGQMQMSDEVPTYYPSATVDTATTVIVKAGEEIAGINIRYRGEQGHAISGNFTIRNSPDSPVRGVLFALLRDPGNVQEAQVYAGLDGQGRSFAFYGVPDGDYFIHAQSISNELGENRGSGRVRVKVKGADLTGLEIALAPLASIAGAVKFEPLLKSDQKSACENKQRLLLNELLLTARRDEKENINEPVSEFRSRSQTTPTDKGEFAISNLETGRYRMEYNLPGESFYVRSITLPLPVPAMPPTDAAQNSLALKSGERLNDLNITIAEGAATIKGKIVPSIEGARLPDQLRAHLVPAEKESANDVLRYAEAIALGDGSFSMSNIAPGRYWIIARADSDDGSGARPRPLAWDAQTRAALHREAEAAQVFIALQNCQRVIDYSLKHITSSPASKPATKK